MSALLVTLWPGRPVVILAIEYHPPMRVARIAPPSLRTPSIDGAQLATVAALLDGEAR